jgi:hypothetical protein
LVNPVTVCTVAHRAPASHDPRVAEPQGWGPPTIADGWSRDPLKGWVRTDTTLADPESIDHATVDVTGFDRQFLKMGQPAGQPEVTGVVDDGLDPECLAALNPGFSSVSRD